MTFDYHIESAGASDERDGLLEIRRGAGLDLNLSGSGVHFAFVNTEGCGEQRQTESGRNEEPTPFTDNQPQVREDKVVLSRGRGNTRGAR